MDAPSTPHMRESYVLKYQSHDTDTPTYMETLSGENAEEYSKVVDGEIQILMRRYAWDIVSGNSVADQIIITVTLSFKFKRTPD